MFGGNGRFLGMNAAGLNEAYSGAASDGLMDGVDFEPNITGSDMAGSYSPTVEKLAWGIVIAALIALWLLGGIIFRISVR